MDQNKYSIEKIQAACRLREIRENTGLSQEKFAEVLGISVSGYKKIESGENIISLDRLKILYKQMSVSTDYILYGEMKSADDIWKSILNCTEEDKLLLLYRLWFYFVKTKKGVFSLTEEQREIDKVIMESIKELQDNGEE
ncbi:MAG: helix-turn-helix domain-containing protein [Lachnospiraceae bacterium]